MMFIRPLIIILVFFSGLFVLREPIRHIDENLAVIQAEYIHPVIDLAKAKIGFGSSSDYGSSVGAQILVSSSTDIVSGTTSTSTSTPKAVNINTGTKEVLVSKDITQTVESSRLSISGILNQTNKERSTKKIGTLKLNTNLNKAAELKLEDMFANQYFQHVSPTGVNVSDLVRKVGYEYIVIGENLALGNFGGDVQVVTAWMNSPGHRANILDTRFQEIGIAVGKGLYNGKEQWIAVQHFAKPLSSCAGPNADLKLKIDTHTTALAALEIDLNASKKQIDTGTPGSYEYQELVSKYNTKVVDYNNRLEALKDEIATYNAEVRTFNTCAGLSTK